VEKYIDNLISINSTSKFCTLKIVVKVFLGIMNGAKKSLIFIIHFKAQIFLMKFVIFIVFSLQKTPKTKVVQDIEVAGIFDKIQNSQDYCQY